VKRRDALLALLGPAIAVITHGKSTVFAEAAISNARFDPTGGLCKVACRVEPPNRIIESRRDGAAGQTGSSPTLKVSNH